MTIEHWEALASAWDTLVLGTNVMPGVWDIDGSARRKLDVKTRKGKDGAIIKDEGYEPARLQLVGEMVADSGDWETMQRVLRELHPRKKGGVRDPLAIDHPKAAFLGITNVYIEEIRTPVIDNGVCRITLTAIEWFPKPQSVKKGKGVPKAPDSPSIRRPDGTTRLSLTFIRETPPSQEAPLFLGGG